MELFLQFGSGMMGLSKDLFSEWGGGTAILSPRDLDPNQIEAIGTELIGLHGNVLLDPQFYLPRADHHRLISYEYWPRDYDTHGFSNANRKRMLKLLVELNKRVGTYSLLVPGERADTVDGIWLESQTSLLSAAQESTDMPLIATICLSSDAVRSIEQINLVMELADTQAVYGYYLVFEHPGGTYLVNDPQWLTNTLDLAVGLRKKKAKVIVGYSNQQQLIMSCAGVSAIASGNWMNVRSFLPEKFLTKYEDDVKRKAVWYYCPQSLSEYRLPFLDIGFRLGLLPDLIPNPKTKYADLLFESPQPSASGWGESLAFRHYLTALNSQVKSSSLGTFNETLEYNINQIRTTGELIKKFRALGISGQTRDLFDALDASLSALIMLNNIHGPIIERRWGEFAQ